MFILDAYHLNSCNKSVLHLETVQYAVRIKHKTAAVHRSFCEILREHKTTNSFWEVVVVVLSRCPSFPLCSCGWLCSEDWWRHTAISFAPDAMLIQLRESADGDAMAVRSGVFEHIRWNTNLQISWQDIHSINRLTHKSVILVHKMGQDSQRLSVGC